MTPRFGTDGVRGRVDGDLVPEVVWALGRAVKRVLDPPTLLVGRDTRESGPALTAALAAGVTSAGGDVVDLGVLPTPGVAWASVTHGLAAAVVSASHNPYRDNGVKVFAAGGRKLEVATEVAIEAEMATALALAPNPVPAVGDHCLGSGELSPGAVAAGYQQYLLSVAGPSGDPLDLDGLEVVLDCAHGSASALAPEVFRRAGARATVINAEPDGRNINAGCGSTHPDQLCREVVDTGAALGLAFDGDADRVLAVDGQGRLVDGDEMIVAFALDRLARSALPGPAVVVTVMANLGLRQALGQAGIEVVETPVGDRHVLERLEGGGWVLGGEQSGHLIFRDRATTGDGMLTGLSLCELVVRSGRSLADLAGSMTRHPQVLDVVRADPARLAQAEAVAEAVARAEQDLGGDGRVLVRGSGTEPVVRVMVEASDLEVARSVCRHLCSVVAAAIGPGGG